MTIERAFWKHAVLLAAFLAICFGFFVVLLRAGGTSLVPGERYEAQAIVPTAVSLVPGAEVRMAGVRVGRVSEIANRRGDAVVRFNLDDRHAPIYRDAMARVRLKSLVGENYLEVDPGTQTAGALRSGGTLRMDDTDEATQLDEIISTLDSRTRRDLKTTLTGLGGGLRGRSDLNRLLGSFSAAVDETSLVFEVLGEQRREVASLVDDIGRVMRALGDRGTAIRALTRGVRTTAEAIARRDRILRESIDELPATLKQARTTAERLGTFSPNATPVVRDLATAAEGLTPVIGQLRPAAAAARTTVDRLEAFAPRWRSLLAQLRPVAGSATRSLPPLDLTLSQLNPALAYVSPFGRDVTAFFSNLRSATNTVDATGNLGRIHAMVGDSSLPGVLTGEQQRALDTLLQVGALSVVRERANNAYPDPGGLARPQPLTRPYPRVEADPLSDPRSRLELNRR